MNKVLFIALREECDIKSFDSTHVIYTGLGKINACQAVYKAMSKLTEQNILSPETVFLNVGTCGSHMHNVGEMLLINSFFHGDFSLEGSFRGSDPILAKRPLENIRGLDIKSSNLLTSDTFVSLQSLSLKTLNTYQAFDMEAYALASTLRLFNRSLTSVKVVSDNLTSISEWKETVKSLNKRIRDAVDVAAGFYS